MSRVLITTWAGGGNANPALNLGARLTRRGHQVQVLGWPEQRGRAESAGLAFSAYPSVAPWPADAPFESDWDGLGARLHGADTAADIVAAAAPDCDLLVVDCMMHAGFLAAAQLDLPTVTLVHLLYRRFWESAAATILPVEPPPLLAASRCVLAAAPAALDAPGELPANTHYVGAITAPDVPSVDALGLGQLREAGDPWVLVSLSTTQQGQRQALPAILVALAALPVRVLLTLGGVPVELEDAPANVLVRDYVPHEAVLPHLAAVVTHGGLSTVTTSLAFGVPLVCIPQGRDQYINAEQVAACGVGLALAPTAAPEDIAAAVRAVTTGPRFRAAAGALRDPRAGERAADLVELVVDQGVLRRSVAAASTSASAALPATTSTSRA